jgi:aromatic ring-opening dioxygenase catalytic subunit (LigB family)
VAGARIAGARVTRARAARRGRHRSAADATRGYDHGTFVPLKLTYPDADVPPCSCRCRRARPAAHIAIGRALAPLRDEGVFIVASGMTFHNLRAFRDPRAAPVSEAFDAWLRESLVLDARRAQRSAGALDVGARPRAPRTRARST